jgi:integrase
MRYVVSSQVLAGRWLPTNAQTTQLRRLGDLCLKAGTNSLLDHDLAQWEIRARTLATELGLGSKSTESGLLSMLRVVYSILERAATDPWDGDEWIVRDVLPDHEGSGRLNWSKVGPPWLKSALRRRAKTQLLTGARSWGTIRSWISAARLFAEFVEDELGGEVQPEDLTRALYWEFIELKVGSIPKRRTLATTLASLLEDLAHEDPSIGLPPVTYVRRGELRQSKKRDPRPYPPDVVKQIEERLLESDLLDDTERRLLGLYRFGGPRASEALCLPLDALQVTGEGHYWIKYVQSKTGEERRFPIPDRLGVDLAEQVRSVQRIYGAGAQHLFPAARKSIPELRDERTGEIRLGGVTKPWAYSGFSKRMKASFEEAGIVSSAVTGEKVSGATLHRFRHTVGTELINSGWSQTEIQRFLGHSSPTMSQAYAKLYDSTIEDKYREVFESSIDHDGQPSGASADAAVEHLREKLEQAVLPNGFCDLPVAQTCDFRPNPCLECSFFRTGREWLPVHIRQRDELHGLVEDASRAGNQRMVEINQPTLDRLNRIVEALTDDEAE